MDKLTEHFKKLINNHGILFHHHASILDGERYFICLSDRVLETDKPVSCYSVYTPYWGVPEFLDSHSELAYCYPINLKELKNKVYGFAGKKKKIFWSNGNIVVNARYLIDAMEALQATKIFEGDGLSDFIWIFENDNQKSRCKEIIFCSKSKTGEIGYFKDKNGEQNYLTK